MKHLNQYLGEGIFDTDLVDNESGPVAGWINTYVDLNYDGFEYRIDQKNKKVIFTPSGKYNRVVREIIIRTNNSPLNGFINYKFVDPNDNEIQNIKFFGDIESVDGIPSQFTSISFYADGAKNGIKPSVFKEISNNVKKINELLFVTYNTNISFKNIDLTQLTSPVRKLYVSHLIEGGEIKFNPNLKVETLQFGYGSLFGWHETYTGTLKNLPIFKTLSFQTGSYEGIKKVLSEIDDKGKSNFNSIVVNCKDLNKEEKEAIKNFLKGEDDGFTGYGETLNKINDINKIINDKDDTKDRFGVILSPGDIVLVACSTDPKYPSRLDIYKSSSGNGRIRTETMMQIPPRNVIKLNNPKILELLK